MHCFYSPVSQKLGQCTSPGPQEVLGHLRPSCISQLVWFRLLKHCVAQLASASVNTSSIFHITASLVPQGLTRVGAAQQGFSLPPQLDHLPVDVSLDYVMMTHSWA